MRAQLLHAPSTPALNLPQKIVNAAPVPAPADLIVIGSHGREGMPRALLGSVAETVVRHAPCPVLVIRAKE